MPYAELHFYFSLQINNCFCSLFQTYPMCSPPLEEISISLIILVILDGKSRQTQFAVYVHDFVVYNFASSKY